MTRTRPLLWRAAEAAAATGGRTEAAWAATGVSIDSRTLVPGDLFVALAGPNFDGHDFVGAAFAAGAAAAMVSRRPAGIGRDQPLLVVADTLEGLTALGRAARHRCVGRIAGVTGSVGKTGVKEALRLVLSKSGPTHASEGSLNNHWGLPLSLARLPRQAAFAVFEMGMNHPGEITPLTRLARPHVAVITTVEAVHRAHFASLEEIARAKAEIFAGVEPGGVAVLNRDNPHFAHLAAAAGAAGVRTVVGFGRHPEAGVRLAGVEEGPGGSEVRAVVGGEPVSYRIAVPGAHWVTNSLCVLATVAALHADVAAAARALSEFTVPKGRGRRLSLDRGAGAFTVIDDSYNASPVSMAAAFEVLGRSAPGRGGRRIAVLGDMLELGDDAPTAHRGLAEALRRNGIDLVFGAGPMMAELFAALPAAMRGAHSADSEALAPIVVDAVRPGDVIVVKGSAGSRMGRIVEALCRGTAEGGTAAVAGT